jgi:hypothetical protein
MYLQGRPVETPTPAHWNHIGRSVTALRSLSPSSELRPPLSRCASISTPTELHSIITKWIQGSLNSGRATWTPLNRFTAYRLLINLSHPTNFHPTIFLNWSQRRWNTILRIWSLIRYGRNFWLQFKNAIFFSTSFYFKIAKSARNTDCTQFLNAPCGFFSLILIFVDSLQIHLNSLGRKWNMSAFEPFGIIPFPGNRSVCNVQQ